MKRGLKILRIFGIDIKIHYSWWFVFALLTWSLATTFFPMYFAGEQTSTYWYMGVSAAVLLFVSVLLHELSHSLVAKARKIKVESITLFFFGGVASITDDDMKPMSEFLMSIAGPLFSLVLGGVFLVIFKSGINGFISAISFYLYQLNFILAAFNMVPGFPLDGGRAFRAVLYGYYKDLQKATRIASAAGRFFAAFLIVLGIFSLFGGAGGGLWFILLGGFLYFIAGASYEQVVVKGILDKIPLKNLMKKKYVSLNPEMSLISFLRKYKNSEIDSFVVQGDNFRGVLNLAAVGPVPTKLRGVVKLKQVAEPFTASLSLKDTAQKAFGIFAETRQSILPVMEGKIIKGIVYRTSLTNRLMIESKFGRHKK